MYKLFLNCWVYNHAKNNLLVTYGECHLTVLKTGNKNKDPSIYSILPVWTVSQYNQTVGERSFSLK